MNLQVLSISSVVVYHQHIALSHSPFLSILLAGVVVVVKTVGMELCRYMSPLLPFCDVGVLLPYVRLLQAGIYSVTMNSVRVAWGGLIWAAVFIPAVRNGGASFGWREIDLEEKAEGRMGRVYERFKVCPIGAGEQGLEMEGSERSGVRSHPCTQGTIDRIWPPNPRQLTRAARRGEREKEKKETQRAFTRQSAG